MVTTNQKPITSRKKSKTKEIKHIKKKIAIKSQGKRAGEKERNREELIKHP